MNKDDLNTLLDQLKGDKPITQMKEKFDKLDDIAVERVAPNSSAELERIRDLAGANGLFRENDSSSIKSTSLFIRFFFRPIQIPFAGVTFASLIFFGVLIGYLSEFQQTKLNQESQLTFRNDASVKSNFPKNVVEVLVEEPLTVLVEILYRLDGLASGIEIAIEQDVIELTIPDSKQARALLSDLGKFEAGEGSSLYLVIRNGSP